MVCFKKSTRSLFQIYLLKKRKDREQIQRERIVEFVEKIKEISIAQAFEECTYICLDFD